MQKNTTLLTLSGVSCFPPENQCFPMKPSLYLEIVVSSNKIFRWGHQMASGINRLVTVGKYNLILMDLLFGIYM
jgi:hypothetical protein